MSPQGRSLFSGRDVNMALQKVGWTLVRQRGSHMLLKHEDGRRVTVPKHKELRAGTLNSILAVAGLSHDELEALL